MKNNIVRPEDILADDKNFADLNGITVRKGSIAAFLKNIDLLENTSSSDEERDMAMNMLKELTPAIISAGLFKHAIFKNKTVQEILEKSAKV